MRARAQCIDRRGNLGGSGRSPGRERAHARRIGNFVRRHAADDDEAIGAQLLEVALHGRRSEHLAIHRRDDDDGRTRRERDRRNELGEVAIGNARDRRCTRGIDHDELGPFGERDMRNGNVRGAWPHRCLRLALCDCGNRIDGSKALRGGRHCHFDGMAAAQQRSEEGRCMARGNRAGDAEHDVDASLRLEGRRLADRARTGEQGEQLVDDVYAIAQRPGEALDMRNHLVARSRYADK